MPLRIHRLAEIWRVFFPGKWRAEASSLLIHEISYSRSLLETLILLRRARHLIDGKHRHWTPGTIIHIRGREATVDMIVIHAILERIKIHSIHRIPGHIHVIREATPHRIHESHAVIREPRIWKWHRWHAWTLHEFKTTKGHLLIERSRGKCGWLVFTLCGL